MMSKILILLGLFACMGCFQKKPSRLRHILSGHNYQYWDAWRDSEQLAYGSYRFDTDGSCYFLKYNYNTKPPNRSFFYQEDIANGSNRFRLLGRDTISIVADAYKYKVQKFDSNYISLLFLKGTKAVNIELHLSKDQTDIMNFDSLKKIKHLNTSYRDD